ncbi:hypothetical protein [Oceaniglobus trochenteri]|uniref:hypothetical protein n=1 Tax=Oceaniglobus trochenteri TaxID=2763260 RepID=UPI001CFF66E6|nr:hypothetical protein [Oceaniglobus trochenteri]
MRNTDRVATLRPVEPVSIDTDCLARLRAAGGETHGEGRLGETLEDLALGLSRVGGAYRRGRFDDIRRECLAIGRIAGLIGLDRMARVAQTSAALSVAGDGVALSANLARLMRMGNDALGAIWDIQDQSM